MRLLGRSDAVQAVLEQQLGSFVTSQAAIFGFQKLIEILFAHGVPIRASESEIALP